MTTALTSVVGGHGMAPVVLDGKDPPPLVPYLVILSEDAGVVLGRAARHRLGPVRKVCHFVGTKEGDQLELAVEEVLSLLVVGQGQASSAASLARRRVRAWRRGWVRGEHVCHFRIKCGFVKGEKTGYFFYCSLLSSLIYYLLFWVRPVRRGIFIFFFYYYG